MQIKYRFINETVNVEVDEKCSVILLDLDRREYNNNQTETRRHASLNAMEYEGELFFDPNSDIAAHLEKAEVQQILHRAMDSLLPQQKELLKKVFFEGVSAAEIARQEGVNKSSVHKRLQRIFEQLRKVFPYLTSEAMSVYSIV